MIFSSLLLYVQQKTMSTSNSKITFVLPVAFLALFLDCASCHAELYKWVDANGRTHYSDHKLDIGKGEAKELRVAAPPPPSPRSTEVPDWKRREFESKRRQAETALQSGDTSSHSQKGSWPGPGARETNETKCALANDVTSGAVVHTNGKKTDQNDRAIAQRDIQRFCR